MSGLLPDMAERYWQLLVRGDVDPFMALFGAAPRVDDPRAGRVDGADDVRRFAARTHEWLADMRAHVSPVRTTRAADRTVAEQDLHLTVDGRDVHLPTAVVAERGDDPRLERLTVYYSTWPITGRHSVRPPVLEIDPELEAPDVVGRYELALAQGNLQAVMECFEPDGYFREPAGDPYVHRGEERLRDFYLTAFGNVGGIVLDLCCITDDGEACAVEYNALKWGRSPMPPQAGIAVYERGTDGMLLHAARVYDDVEPPAEAMSASPVASEAARGD